jgi:putative oxidoreductase
LLRFSFSRNNQRKNSGETTGYMFSDKSNTLYIFKNKIRAMLKKYSTDYGLLIIRAGIGIMFMLHGYPKMVGGMEKWTKLGGAMKNIGIEFMPAFWGFMGAFAELGGGFCLVLGFLFRPALAMLIFTMFIAFMVHFTNGDGFGGYAHALESAIVFTGLFIAGPGKYALKIVRR